MESNQARKLFTQLDHTDKDAIRSLLRQIGPYGDIDVISGLLRSLNKLGMKRLSIDVLLIDEMRWPKNVARKLIKESGVK